MQNKPGALTDTELVKLLKAGGKNAEAAFTEIYRRYSSMVHAYCFRVFNNQQQAEDIFQETFIKFYQSINSSTNASNLAGYLIKIARNICLNQKRENKNVVSMEDMDAPFEVNELTYEKKEILELINMAVELLAFEFREAFVLREYDELSYQDIADICGISLANAKSRVFRAKQKIKDILAPYLNDFCK